MTVTVKRPVWADIKFPDFKNCIVLDIGCSTTKRELSNNYYSLDINKNFKPSILGDACYLPVRNDSIDVVLLISVLEHLREPCMAVNEAYRVLKKSGRVYVYVPFMFYRHDAMDYFRFTKEGLQYVLREFKDLKVEMKYCGFFSMITSWIIPIT